MMNHLSFPPLLLISYKYKSDIENFVTVVQLFSSQFDTCSTSLQKLFNTFNMAQSSSFSVVLVVMVVLVASCHQVMSNVYYAGANNPHVDYYTFQSQINACHPDQKNTLGFTIWCGNSQPYTPCWVESDTIYPGKCQIACEYQEYCGDSEAMLIKLLNEAPGVAHCEKTLVKGVAPHDFTYGSCSKF